MRISFPSTAATERKADGLIRRRIRLRHAPRRRNLVRPAADGHPRPPRGVRVDVLGPNVERRDAQLAQRHVQGLGVRFGARRRPRRLVAKRRPVGWGGGSSDRRHHPLLFGVVDVVLLVVLFVDGRDVGDVGDFGVGAAAATAAAAAAAVLPRLRPKVPRRFGVAQRRRAPPQLARCRCLPLSRPVLVLQTRFHYKKNTTVSLTYNCWNQRLPVFRGPCTNFRNTCHSKGMPNSLPTDEGLVAPLWDYGPLVERRWCDKKPAMEMNSCYRVGIPRWRCSRSSSKVTTINAN